MKYIGRRKLVGLLIVAGVLWSVLMLLSDVSRVVRSIKHISEKRMLLVGVLSGVNYWVRLARFNWLTRRVAKAKIDGQVNSLIFFSGLSMNLTPARVGELVKAYWQHRLFGESFARMAPIVVAERLADSLAILLMMGAGVLLFKMGGMMFVVLLGIVLGVVLVVHRRDLGARVASLLQKLPGGGKVAGPIERALAVSYRLTGWWPLLVSAGLGVMAWVAEATGLWVLVGGVGVVPSWSSFQATLFTFALAATVGFVSIIPGGIGFNELSTIELLRRLMGVAFADALVATFAFRLVTLWFGVFLGLVSLVYLDRREGKG